MCLTKSLNFSGLIVRLTKTCSRFDIKMVKSSSPTAQKTHPFSNNCTISISKLRKIRQRFGTCKCTLSCNLAAMRKCEVSQDLYFVLSSKRCILRADVHVSVLWLAGDINSNGVLWLLDMHGVLRLLEVHGVLTYTLFLVSWLIHCWWETWCHVMCRWCGIAWFPVTSPRWEIGWCLATKLMWNCTMSRDL